MEEFGRMEGGWEFVFYKPDSKWLRIEISKDCDELTGLCENYKSFMTVDASSINIILVDIGKNDELIVTVGSINGAYRDTFTENMALVWQVTNQIPEQILLGYLPEIEQ